MKTKNDDDHRDNHFDSDDEEEEDADKDEKDSDSDLYEVMPKKIRSGNHRGTTSDLETTEAQQRRKVMKCQPFWMEWQKVIRPGF